MELSQPCEDKLLSACRQAQYILKLCRLRDNLLYEEQKRLSESLERIGDYSRNFKLNENTIRDAVFQTEYNAKNTEGWTDTMLNDPGFPMAIVPLKGRRVLEPINRLQRVQNTENEDPEMQSGPLGVAVIENYKNFAIRPTYNPMQNLISIHKDKLLSIYTDTKEDDDYRNPRNSPVNFTVRHNNRYPVPTLKLIDGSRTDKVCEYNDAQSTLKPVKKELPGLSPRYLNGAVRQDDRRLKTKPDNVVFYLGAKRLSPSEERPSCRVSSQEENHKQDKEIKSIKEDKSNSFINLPHININTDNLLDFSKRRQIHHEKLYNADKYSLMFDKNALSIQYRLSLKKKETPDSIPCCKRHSFPQDPSPVQQFCHQYGHQYDQHYGQQYTLKMKSIARTKLPSIKTSSDLHDDTNLILDSSRIKLGEIPAHTKCKTKTADCKYEERANYVRDHTSDEVDQSEKKKQIVVKMPKIDFQPASPEVVVNCQRVTKTRPKLSLTKALSQGKLRQKEVRNLLEDVKDLTDYAENLSEQLKIKTSK